MDHCHKCSGSCGQCGGCANTLVLTEAEIDMLLTFSQIPFLPVARKADDMTPVYLEETGQDYAAILACLEKKGLIDIDYHAPLRGFDYSAYEAYPLHGSMALTSRGQSVVESLELHGATEEVSCEENSSCYFAKDGVY